MPVTSTPIKTRPDAGKQLHLHTVQSHRDERVRDVLKSTQGQRKINPFNAAKTAFDEAGKHSKAAAANLYNDSANSLMIAARQGTPENRENVIDSAIDRYQTARKSYPRHASSANNLGVAKAMKAQLRESAGDKQGAEKLRGEAVAHFKKANDIRKNPLFQQNQATVEAKTPDLTVSDKITRGALKVEPKAAPHKNESPAQQHASMLERVASDQAHRKQQHRRSTGDVLDLGAKSPKTAELQSQKTKAVMSEATGVQKARQSAAGNTRTSTVHFQGDATPIRVDAESKAIIDACQKTGGSYAETRIDAKGTQVTWMTSKQGFAGPVSQVNTANQTYFVREEVTTSKWTGGEKVGAVYKQVTGTDGKMKYEQVTGAEAKKVLAATDACMKKGELMRFEYQSKSGDTFIETAGEWKQHEGVWKKNETAPTHTTAKGVKLKGEADKLRINTEVPSVFFPKRDTTKQLSKTRDETANTLVAMEKTAITEREAVALRTPAAALADMATKHKAKTLVDDMKTYMVYEDKSEFKAMFMDKNGKEVFLVGRRTDDGEFKFNIENQAEKASDKGMIDNVNPYSAAEVLIKRQNQYTANAALYRGLNGEQKKLIKAVVKAEPAYVVSPDALEKDKLTLDELEQFKEMAEQEPERLVETENWVLKHVTRQGGLRDQFRVARGQLNNRISEGLVEGGKLEVKPHEISMKAMGEHQKQREREGALANGEEDQAKAA